MTALLIGLIAGGLLGLLLKVAIFCVIVWAIFALLAWAGIAIPQPIKIILIALVCIVVIYWLFQIIPALF